MDGIYSEEFKIRANEVDGRGKATLPAICNLLQEVAGNHALELSFDITDLKKQNLTWVLHRLHIRMYRYPQWRENITIETWPSHGDRLRAYRDYRITGNNEKELGVALSYWMIMDLGSRRPQRMPEAVVQLGLPDIPHTLPIQKSRFKADDAIEDSYEIEVRKSDLDMNKHVNNVRYVQWMLDMLPEEPHNITEMDIQFLAESVAGDTITGGFGETGKGILYQLFNDKKPVAIGISNPVNPTQVQNQG